MVLYYYALQVKCVLLDRSNAHVREWETPPQYVFNISFLIRA